MISCLEGPPSPEYPVLVPIAGTLKDLLSSEHIKCLIVDLHSSRALKQIIIASRQARPRIQLIVIGPTGNDELILDAIRAGARGYLDVNTTPEFLRRAVETVASGSMWVSRRLLSKLVDRLLKLAGPNIADEIPHFTAREQQVLALVLDARSNREIALDLGLDERTVKKHLGHVLAKTGTKSRLDLSMMEFNRLSGAVVKCSERRKGSPAGTPPLSREN